MNLKKTAIGILVLLAIFPGSCVMNVKIAQYRAERICSSVELGATYSTAEEILKRDGPPVSKIGSYTDDYTSIEPDGMAVVYWSWRGFDRWVCNIRFANGKVSEKEVRFID